MSTARVIRPTSVNPRAAAYRASGALPDRFLWQPLESAAAEHPDRIAVVDDGIELSFGEYWSRVRSVAAALLELGVSPGTCVVYQLPNRWEALVVHFAIAYAGAIGVPMVGTHREHELGFVIGQLRPSLAVATGGLVAPMADALAAAGHDCPLIVARPEPGEPGLDLAGLLGGAPAAAPAGAPSDVATIIYTSGSTGSPKGVLHSHETLLADAGTRIPDFALTEDDVIFMPSSLAHIAGLSYGAHLPALLGCRTVLMARWSPEGAVDLVESSGATVMNGAPLMLRSMTEVYESRASGSSLRVFACGGADVSERMVLDARRVLDAFVTRAYGCSEIPTLCWGKPSDDPARTAATDGRPIGAVELRVVAEDGTVLGTDEIGECVAIGPERGVGYVDASLNDALYTADGWVRTGDLVSVDAEGYLTVHGRKKDIIVRAGENISAREIELLLLAHDAVVEAAVVPSPDPVVGERTHAVVLLRPGTGLTLDEVKEWMAAQGVAKIKWPELLTVLDEFPRSAFGKIDKPRLRSILAEAS